MQMRKLFAGLAAAATLLGGLAIGAATANAAEVTLDDSYKPTITLTKSDDKAETGEYTAYQLAGYTDAVVNDKGQLTSIGLTKTEDYGKWEANFKQALTDAGITEKLNDSNGEKSILYTLARLDTVNDGAELRKFVETLKVPTKLGSDEPSVTGTTLTLGTATEVPAAGWYFVTDTKGTNLLVATALKDTEGTVYNSLFNTEADPATEQKLGVAEVKPDVTPVPDKTAKWTDGSSASTAEVGQTLNYVVSGKVPNTTGFATYSYKFSDVASKGLTVNKDSLKVYYDENTNGKYDTEDTLLKNTAYTVEGPTVDTATGETTTTVTVANVAGNDGKTIALQYTATVNGDALDQVTNKATVNHNGGAESGEKTVTTKFGSFTFTKVDAQDNGIEGAYFDVIYSGSNDNGMVFKKIGDGVYVRAADKDYNESDVNKEYKDVENGQYTVNLRSPKNGVITVQGLKATGYVVREQKPAEGYMQSVKGNFVVQLTFDQQSDAISTEFNSVKHQDLFKLVTISKDKSTATVLNVKNVTELPKTGAAGIAMFMAVAALLGGAAATVFAKSRSAKRALNA